MPNNYKTNSEPAKTLSDESLLYTYWQYFCHNKQFLSSYQLRGIDHGQLNKHDGPDFQGAEFELNGKIYRGDVEIHKKTSEWYQHGHHLDIRYDRVVLHLVWQDSPQSVINSKGQFIPSICMKSIPSPRSTKKIPSICIMNQPQEPLLHNLAWQRMCLKGKEIQRLVSAVGIDQALYRMLLKALGNTQNRENYERISSIVPWKYIHHLKEKSNPPLTYWQALFRGVAGFMQESDDEELKLFWQKLYPTVQGKVLKKEQWKGGGIRPHNHPRIRLDGLAIYVSQLKVSSIYQNMYTIFCERLDPSLLIKRLMKNFAPSTQHDQYKMSTFSGSAWGKNLIIEMTGNVFLPFFYFEAIQKESYGFAAYLQSFYFGLPATLPYSRLAPFQHSPAIQGSAKRYFYVNQALIQLQNNYCYLLKCNTCPFQSFQQKN